MQKAKVGTFVKHSKCKAAEVRIAQPITTGLVRVVRRAFIFTCLASDEFRIPLFDYRGTRFNDLTSSKRAYARDLCHTRKIRLIGNSTMTKLFYHVTTTKDEKKKLSLPDRTFCFCFFFVFFFFVKGLLIVGT